MRIVKKPKISEGIKAEIRKTFANPDEAIMDIPQSLISHPLGFYKKLDPNFENFFYQRTYDQENFCLYLKVLAERRRIDLLPSAIEKMKLMKIEFTEPIYSGIISCYAKYGNSSKAEEIFKEAIRGGVKPTVVMYTSLLNSYVDKGDEIAAEKIVKEMESKGIKPDAAAYTSLIFISQKAHNFENCWKIFEKAELNKQVDHYMISFMIRICSYVYLKNIKHF